MKLTFLVPGLLHPPAPLSDLADALPRTPALRTLLGRADRMALKARGIDATVCALAGLSALPAGALTALAADEDPGDCWWLRADPVHLAADADGLRLVCGEALAVTDDEAATLTVFLATQLNIKLHCATPAHWYFTRAPLAVTTHRPEDALGHRIEALLPSGADASVLRRWLNEVQMLLHAHPVNLRRADAGQLAVNSVWPWGCGPLGAAGAWRYEVTYANDPVLTGLAARHGRDAAAVPRGLLQAAGADCVVRLDEAHEASRLGDVERWLAAVCGLERDWFAPAQRLLRDGTMGELTVYDCDGACFTVRPAMRWRIWRRALVLEAD